MHHSEKFLIDLDNMESETSEEESEDESQSQSEITPIKINENGKQGGPIMRTVTNQPSSSFSPMKEQSDTNLKGRRRSTLHTSDEIGILNNFSHGIVKVAKKKIFERKTKAMK